MAKKVPITVEDLWQIERVGAPSLAGDGVQAVVSVTSHSMTTNQASSSLWLLNTLGGTPRALTHCGDKDGQPRFSPAGDLIAFVGKRDQQGHKDQEAQLYVIAADGGEARRVATVATGVEAFRWFPNGRRIAFVSWVWPELKGSTAQAKKHKDFKARKETGYVTSEALYRYWDHHLPMGREAHLHTIDLGLGKVRNLFEGSPYALTRADPDSNSFDISPDGKHVVFAFDPAPEKRVDGRFALAEAELKSGRIKVIAQDAGWDFGAPRYSPDGQQIAFLASHQAVKHTMPQQLARWHRGSGQWSVMNDVSDPIGDPEPHAPLHWDDDASGILFAAEQRGRRHLWRFDVTTRHAEILAAGGWVSAFDQAAGTLVTQADSALHPAQIFVHDQPAKLDAGSAVKPTAQRIESFNNTLLSRLRFGAVEEIEVTGALGDPVQVWMVYPPGFDAKKGKKYPLLHNIHGGPHAAAADTWHYRWNTQLFAAQGYVVACVNYHGSSGFGHAFLDSITHRWGELELQDVEAATDVLLKKPWIDKRRVFATGGSYGGFMVAWMNGHVPAGRYAAYVCHAGCFDWTAMFADDGYTWQAKELGAWYWDDPAQIQRQSPHSFASAMTTPTLVIHGALDYRVPDAQGLAYYNTLKARGVDARLLWFPDENHWVLKARNSRLWYAEFFNWLKAHDPGPARRRA